MKYLREAGDTIVEVLMALSVTSLLITGAFVTSNKSLYSARRAQERGEALKVAEGQAETLRSLALTVGFAVNSPTIFCLDPLGAFQVVTTGFSSVPIGYAGDPLTGYPAACRQGNGGLYHVSIVRNLGTDHLFLIRVRWQHVGDAGNDESVIRTQVY